MELGAQGLWGRIGWMAPVMVVIGLAAALSFAAEGRAQTQAPVLAVQSQACAQGTDNITVALRWAPQGSGPQWIDLSLANNGFAPGTFVGIGPLDPVASTFTWSGLLPGKTHYARVNVLTPAGWRSSATISFATGVCHLPASGFTITAQECSATLTDRVKITGAWRPGEGTQWVDLSLHNNAFAPGTFIGTGPLASGTATIVWDGLLTDRWHYLRVNTLTAAGWKASGTVAIKTARCGTGGRPVVTLTFDDGGAYADDILDILEQKGVRAIFFPTGTWARANPQLLQRMMSSGHLVGNHTYSHANLAALSDEQIRAELSGGAAGNSDLFRPTYGIINTRIRAIVEQMGLRVYMWHIDTLDWKRTYPGGDREIVAEVTTKAFPGAVVLFHMQSWNTPLALPAIIDQLRAAGYELTW